MPCQRLIDDYSKYSGSGTLSSCLSTRENYSTFLKIDYGGPKDSMSEKCPEKLPQQHTVAIVAGSLSLH